MIIETDHEAIASSDLLALYRKMINAHYSMAADEYRENPNYAGMRKRFEKFNQAEKVFLDALNKVCERANVQ